MTKPRTTQVYQLIQGREVVYIGTSNDLERREQQHRKEGKKFTRMEVVSSRMTEEGAKKKEAEMLTTYRKNHQGRNPKYNKDPKG